MHQYDDFEKQYEFETKRLVEYVYKSLSSGNSTVAVKKELIFKGVSESEANYIVDYIYKKKRWQIAWQRAGSGTKPVMVGLVTLFAAFFTLLIDLIISPMLVSVLPGLVWVNGALLLVSTLMFISGAVTSLWGAFRIMTASEDSMRGCLTAAVVGFVLSAIVAAIYLLVKLFA